MSNEFMLKGMTQIIVMGETAFSANGGAMEMPACVLLADDYDKAYLAVENALKDVRGFDDNITVQWIAHCPSLEHDRGLISVVCNRGYQVVAGLISDRLKEAKSQTPRVLPLPFENRYAFHEANADFGLLMSTAVNSVGDELD